MTIRILLADDHPLDRAGLDLLLRTEADLLVVGEAGDADTTLRLAADRRPDVVVLDVHMPGLSGLDAVRELTRDGPPDDRDHTVKIVALTTHDVDDAVLAMLRGGATGFVLKDAAPDELATAIRTVADGGVWLDSSVARGLLVDVDRRPGSRVPRPATMDELTAREREVLVLLAHGYSTREISARLAVADATVRTHLSRTLMKLGLRNRAQAVTAAYRSALLRPDDDPPPGEQPLGARPPG